MATILSDEILRNLNCSICKQYLSFGPTKIHSNKVISCGRCNTNETTCANSLYEKVARFALFPCINRYDGCNKLLQYKDVPQHEKSCNGTKVVCPICPSEGTKEISLLCLIDHYKNFHMEYFLNEPKFVIDFEKSLESTYLYCDNLNNCLFFITIRNTQDRLFLNASVSGTEKVVQRFRLNNILLEPNTVRLCTLFPATSHQFEVKIQEALTEKDHQISCEFLYEVVEKTLPMIIATDLNFKEPEKTERRFRKMPKLFIDANIFPGKHKFKLSPCNTMLIDEYDDKFSLKLKCDLCQTYYWNIFEWKETCLFEIQPTEGDKYSLICSSIKSKDIICSPCHDFLKDISKSRVNVLNFSKVLSRLFSLLFYCRHNCGTVWPITKLASHEKQCNDNLEKDSDTFVKKCFGEVSYRSENKFKVEFVNGNLVGPFVFVGSDLIERVIYLINDDGHRLKIFFKHMNGGIYVRIEHDLDKNKYFIVFRAKNYPWEEIIFNDCSNYYPVNSLVKVVSGDVLIGFAFEPFMVFCKKIYPNSIVTL